MPATLQLEHLEVLRADPELYARTNLKIRTKPRPGEPDQLEPFNYNFAQRLVTEKIDRQLAETGRIRAIILKARQLGMSTFIAGRIYQGCTLWARRRAMVLADKTDRAAEIFEIYERFNDEGSPHLRPPPKTTRKARELAWTTGSKITVETANDKDAGRGSTLNFVHASEFALWPYPEDTMAGLQDGMPADAGEFWIESTAQGVGNYFHELWLDAEAGENEFLAIFLPWFIDPGYRLPVTDLEREEILTTTDPWERMALDVGIFWEGRAWRLDPEQLAWRRVKIREKGDERIFKQENPSTAEEAFLLSGSPFFDPEAVRDLFKFARDPIARGSFFDLGGGAFAFREVDRGYVKIWEQPDPNGHYVIGADTAEGKLAEGRDASIADRENERGGRDYSSADVFKVSELRDHPGKPGVKIRVPVLRQVAQVHGRDGLPPETFAQQVYAAAAYWSCPGPPHDRGVRRICLTGVERNHSSGQTTLKQLREVHRHPDLFIHKRMNYRKGQPTLEIGWITDGETRMPMLDALAARVRDGTIEICSKDTLRELATFVRGDDGRPEAQEGAHDDRVISAAIGVQMSQHHVDQPVSNLEPEVEDTPTGT